jgi:hypothetical protein
VSALQDAKFTGAGRKSRESRGPRNGTQDASAAGGFTTMRTVSLLIVLSLVGVPAFAADLSTSAFDVLVRVNGPVRVAANETTKSVVVINSHAVIDGVIDGTLVVFNGRADIRGEVRGNVVVFGDAFLATGSRVLQDVTIYGGALGREDGAFVNGQIHLEQSPDFIAPSAVSIFLAIAVFALGGTLLLTLIAWRPLSNSAALVLAHPFNVFAIGTLVALSVPAAAIAILPTGIGVLLGLAVLICVIPAAIFTGFAVSAMAIGDWIALREPHLIPVQPQTRALAEVTIGVVVSMLVLLIPVVGVGLLLVASTMGAGALVARLWEAWPRRQVPRTAVS